MSDDPMALSNIMKLPNEAADDDPADLMEIAAAIDRIKAEIAIGARPANGAFDAIERIADIAFVLHERSVEQTLCDGLDTALRDLSDACAGSDAAAQRMRHADELLGALATRLRELIAQTAARHHDNSTAAATAAVRSIDERLPPASMEVGSFEFKRGDAAPPRAPLAVLAAEQVDNVVSPRNGGTATEHRPNDDLLPPLDLETGPPKDRIGNQSHPADGEESSTHLPSHGVDALSAAEEDPGDLFEPDLGSGIDAAADQRTSAAAPVEGAAPLHDANAATAGASPRQLSTDALAAVRALSEEELIALFS
jgi:hypothetical protein